MVCQGVCQCARMMHNCKAMKVLFPARNSLNRHFKTTTFLQIFCSDKDTASKTQRGAEGVLTLKLELSHSLHSGHSHSLKNQKVPWLPISGAPKVQLISWNVFQHTHQQSRTLMELNTPFRQSHSLSRSTMEKLRVGAFPPPSFTCSRHSTTPAGPRAAVCC